MSMRVVIRSRLPVSKSAMLGLLRQGNTLSFVAKGIISYDSVPEKFVEGVNYNIRPRLFGIFPADDHHVTFTEIDEPNGIIRTEEESNAITSWLHTMEVTQVDKQTCEYTDVVTIDAGRMTVIFWLFALLFYRHRHRRWRNVFAKMHLNSTL